jgi:3-oxoacyl-[acyl-carrier protein] reductase
MKTQNSLRDETEDKPVALVTGAARGIGAAIALELAKNGFDVAINDICEEEQAKPTVNQIRATGATTIFIKADISNAEGRSLILDVMRKEFSRIDILVNNAGIAPMSRVDLLEASEESFDRVLKVNLKGPYFLSQLIAKWMIQLRQDEGRSKMKIVNIASISSYTSSPSRGEYCVSKAGVSMMTKLFADRLAEYGINVYELRPGIIYSPMTEPVREKYDKLIAEGVTPIKRWGTPEDVAMAVTAIAKDHFPFSTGSVFDIDGGFHLRRL